MDTIQFIRVSAETSPISDSLKVACSMQVHVGKSRIWCSVHCTTMRVCCCWLLLLATMAAASTPMSGGIDENGRCRILSFLAAGQGNLEEHVPVLYERWTSQQSMRVSQSYLAAAQMAVDHFNARDASVIGEIADLPAECFVTLELDVVAKVLDGVQAGQTLLERAWETCAMLLPTQASTSLSLQPMAQALQLPHVLFAPEDMRLVQPLAIGLVPGVFDRITAMAEYLQMGPMEPRNYLAIVYEGEYRASLLAECFKDDAGFRYGISNLIYQDDHLGADPSVTRESKQREILQEIRDSGVKTIFLSKLRAEELEAFSALLDEYGLLSNEYLYLLHPELAPADAIGNVFSHVVPQSPLDRLLKGAMVLDRLDGFRQPNKDQAFLAAWQSRSAATLQAWNEMGLPFVPQDESFFDMPPAMYASMVYDSVMLTGLGACARQVDNTTALYDAMLGSTFDGASGRIEFGCDANSGMLQCPTGIMWGVYNIRAIGERSGTNTYEAVLTSSFVIGGAWTILEDFVYRDGTTTAPTLVREAADNNFLSSGVRAVGFTLMGIAWLLALVGLVMLQYYRKDTTITRAQPLFMMLLCAGSFIMSVSMLTLSFDEGSGWTDAQLDAACMATPWLFFVGQMLVFSALFSKLMRVHRVLQFRRHAVTMKNAIIPLLIMLGITIVILTVWTVVDPWTWTRIKVSEVPYVTYGECRSAHFWAFFGPLMGLLVVAEVLTAWFAWKTADVSDDFADGSTAVYAIVTQIQAWVIGVPIMAVLNNSSANAMYFGRVLLIWIFSISSVVLVVGPKLWRTLYLRRHPEEAALLKSIARVSVTGVSPTGQLSGSKFRASHTHSTSLPEEPSQSETNFSMRESALSTTIPEMEPSPEFHGESSQGNLSQES